MIKRQRDAFKAEVIVAVKEQVLSELGPGFHEPVRSSSAEAVLTALQAGKPVDETAKLSALLEEGRILQGGLRSAEVDSAVIYGDEAAAIGRWEGKARAALVRMEDCLRDFENAPGFDGFTLSSSQTYRRMDAQLAALESAIRQAVKDRKL